MSEDQALVNVRWSVLQGRQSTAINMQDSQIICLLPSTFMSDQVSKRLPVLMYDSGVNNVSNPPGVFADGNNLNGVFQIPGISHLGHVLMKCRNFRMLLLVTVISIGRQCWVTMTMEDDYSGPGTHHVFGLEVF